jgi:glycosyltransferase involved in cell wall biosynthesis
MRILNILFNYKKGAHDNQILGVERCFLDYSKYFVKLGHNIISVAQNGVCYLDEVEKTGSKTFVMKASSQLDFVTMLKMFWLFLRFRPEIAICHSKKALYFARIARLFSFSKVVLVAINHGVRVEKFLKADYVLAVNSYFTSKLIEAGIDEKHAIAIPNMIEVASNFILPQKEKFRNPLKIGALGRLYPEKNFDKILQAMAILRDEFGVECEFVIGGVGPQQKPLEDLAKELGLEKNFKILGWTSDKKSFFEEIDIFILPSWGETFGIVLLEAMLYNTPIITSNSWGPDEIIDEGIDGLKVSKDDAKLMPHLLAKAILRLKNDEEFAKKLAQNAHKKFFEKYEANVVAKNLENIFKEILNKS